MPANRASHIGTLLLIAILALLPRMALLAGYEPVSYLDTGTYMSAARDLVRGDASEGEGRRTPGYPVVIALAQGDAASIMRIQVAAGIVTSVLAGWLTLLLTGRRGFAVAAGLAHAWNMQQLFQESAILTETISAFSVVVTAVLWVAALYRIEARRPWMATMLMASLVAAYAILVRPQFMGFVLLFPVVAFAALRNRGTRLGLRLALSALTAVPIVAVLLAWGAIQHARAGYFTMSTQPAFGLVNHTIDYIELARDEWAKPRQILLETRERRQQEVGHTRNTIWYALPALKREMGWTLPQANMAMQVMCRQLIADHPLRYAKSVVSAFVDFWTVPFFWLPEKLHPPALRPAVEGLWWLEHKLLRLANLAFVLLVAGVLVWPPLRRGVGWDLALSSAAATILMSSLIQAMADQGASSRYHLPTQTLAVVVLLVAAARWQSGCGTKPVP